MQNTKHAPEKVSLIIAIVDRGKGKRLTARMHDEGVRFDLCLLGHGTADSSLLDYLGLGETEKNIILGGIETVRARPLLQKLKQEFSMERAGGGIAFSIPIVSVGGAQTLGFLAGHEEGELKNER